LHLLANEVTEHNEVIVFDTTQLYGELGKFRCLQFAEDAVQGAIDLRDPERIVLEYPRAILHCMEHNAPAFRQAFLIGHGVGTMARRYPGERFVVAELDEKVLELSRAYFDYRWDNVVIGDGRTILGEQDSGAFDCILLDAFSKAGTPAHLTTLEFFQMAKEKLASRGMILLNLMGKPSHDKRVSSIHTTLREVFRYTRVFYLPGEDKEEQRNILLLAREEPIEAEMSEMAGFVELEPAAGHVVRDRRNGSSRTV
jgi:spermidine synthase